MLRNKNNRVVVLAGFLVVLVAAGILWSTLRRDQTPRAVPVIIYLVDTLRADRLGVYGHSRLTSPEIDALARDSVVFDQAYAPAPWTLPSVASLITSTFACEHGIFERKKLSTELPTLAERLKSAGYFTGGIYHNIWVGPLLSLDRGYDEFLYRINEKEKWKMDFTGLMQKTDGRPFFFYLHSVEPHETQETPWRFITHFGHVSTDDRMMFKKDFKFYNALRQVDWTAGRSVRITENTDQQVQMINSLRDQRETIDILYDAAVLWADSNVSEIISVLKQRDIWDDAIFIFLSDHGEEFGEHGGWNHGQSAYEELMRVPLIMHFPNDEFAGLRLHDPASLVDVMPTIFDYLGRPDLCQNCRGTSLLPLMRGDAMRADGDKVIVPGIRINRPYYYKPWEASRGDVNVVIRQATWKGIWNHELESIELYDLQSDPSEQADISLRHEIVAQSLSERARSWLRECGNLAKQPEAIGEVDQKAIDDLRALGYFN